MMRAAASEEKNPNLTTTATKIKKLKGLQFVAARIERKSLTKPWGLGFVSTNNTNTNTNTNNSSTGADATSTSSDVGVLGANRVIVVTSCSNNNGNENVPVPWARSILPHRQDLEPKNVYSNHHSRNRSNSNTASRTTTTATTTNGDSSIQNNTPIN